MAGDQPRLGQAASRATTDPYDEAARDWLARAWSCAADSPGHARCVRGYVLARLMVGEHEASDSLAEAIDLSVSRTLDMSRDEYRRLEAATTCKGAKTSSVKRALLLRAIERDFDMTFPRYATGSLRTISQLCEQVGRLRGTGGQREQFRNANYILS